MTQPSTSAEPALPDERDVAELLPRAGADDDGADDGVLVDPDDPRLTVMGLLAETWAGLASAGRAQLAEHGLGDVEFEVLLRITRSPGAMLRLTDLAAQTSLSSSGITRVVDRLEAAGSVCRQACATDRRTTYAVVTEAGRMRLSAALPGHLELVERWLVRPLSAEQLSALMDALRVVRDGVRPCATAGSRRPLPTGDPVATVVMPSATT
jgi:MarR family 2-MHQ and catechol resistance regulon transcriptional repressor